MQTKVEEKTSELMVSDEGTASDQESIQSETIESRFGSIEINRKASVFFPQGIPGIPGNLQFCLADFPDRKSDLGYKIFQSLDDHSLSFIVIASDYENDLIDASDMEEACEVLSVIPDKLLVLFIVSASQTPQGRELSLNVRAPILIDVKKKIGVQHVFNNPKYHIQHKIV